MKIYVKSVLGLCQKMRIEADENDSIELIKKQVVIGQALPSSHSEETILMKDGVDLDDKASVKDSGVKKNDVLVLRPKHVYVSSRGTFSLIRIIKNLSNRMNGR